MNWPARQASHIARFYDDTTPLEWTYLRLRPFVVDFEFIRNTIGRRTRILDVACGYGQLCLYLASMNPQARPVGLDIDARRILKAQEAADNGRLPARFSVADAGRPLPSGFEAVLLVDGLHLISGSQQEQALANCFSALRPGGKLVLRESIKDSSWRFRCGALHEWLMTRLGWTCAAGLEFLDRERIGRLLRGAGFSRIEQVPVRGFHPYPDIFFICRRDGD